MTNISRRDAFAVTTAALVGGLSVSAAEPKTRIAVVVGPSGHPPGTHEVAAGGRLIKQALESIKGLTIHADVISEWPADAISLNDVSTFVFIGDLFPAAVMPLAHKILADLDVFMKKGAGMVCLHYATGLEAKHVAEDGAHPLLGWIGGYFATRCKHHQSVAKVFQKATIEPTKAEHPVNRGWKPFTLHDEPYINNYFGKDGPAKNVTILATAELPPEKPKAEAVAWAVTREDTGRGAGIVMPHFYRNWKDDDLRKLIFNAIVWSAKLDVPKDGVSVTLPELETFKPASVEPVPKKK
ncbi:ThuA domain-containing protein [soil metagenome]